MTISNIIDWCKLAREEDHKNVLYANFIYEVDNKHIDNETLKKFENEIKDTEANLTTFKEANEFIIEASKKAELFFSGNKFSMPKDGVARVMFAEAFEQEYRSFLNGITAGPDESQSLHLKLRDNPVEAEKYIAAAKSQKIAEIFAKNHTKTLKKVYNKKGQDFPATSTDFREIDENKITWVTKTKDMEKMLRKNTANQANVASRVLGLNYGEPLHNGNIQLVMVKYRPINSDINLHKPTIFSLGFVDAYCATGGVNGWGCTAELETGEPGLPEAVAPRRVFEEMTFSDFLGIIDFNGTPTVQQPNRNKVSERLGHEIGDRCDCVTAPCPRMSSNGFGE